jgi:hypothetical protein
MDDFDTPGWTVNPAFHPEVNAFIHQHEKNAAFVKKARALQQNRCSYYNEIRRQIEAAPAIEALPISETAEETPLLDTAATTPRNIPAVSEEIQPLFTITSPTEEDAHRPRVGIVRRLAGWTALAACLALAAGLGYCLYADYEAARQLRDVLAELDAADPSWRWADLAARPMRPDADNAAAIVQASAERLTEAWKNGAIPWPFVDLPPNQKLDSGQMRRLDEELAVETEALSLARRLAFFDEGWPNDPVLDADWDEPISTSAKPFDALGSLLWLEADWRADHGEIDRSLENARLLIHLSRAAAYDLNPSVLQQRDDLARGACAVIERALAQGIASPTDLEFTRQLVNEEANRPRLAERFRLHRAVAHLVLDEPLVYCSRRLGSSLRLSVDHPLASMEAQLRGGQLKQAHVRVLQVATRAIGLANLPIPQRVGPLALWRDEVAEARAAAKAAGELVAPFLGDLLEIETRGVDAEASLACTAVALACERFRMVEARWPDSIEELVPRFLESVPLDPRVGQPLVLTACEGGILIQSGSLSREEESSASGRESRPRGPLASPPRVRLWNVEERGRSVEPQTMP